MEVSEIKALISLLDDPDEEIKTQVKARIQEEGLAILPYLETVENDMECGAELLEAVTEIKEELRYDVLRRELLEWKESGAEDLLGACIHIARFHDPELEEAEVRSFVSKVRQDIWLELNENLTAFEQVKVMNILLFEEYGFFGDKEDYHHPDNSLIHKVISERKGNPLSLSILYIILAESLDIPVSGVNLPNHFIVAYIDELAGLMEKIGGKECSGTDVLFYINPYSKGAILHKAEIDDFLEHLDIEQDIRFISACGHVEIIRRMLNNLIHAHSRREDALKMEQMKKLLLLISDDSLTDTERI